MADQPIGPRSVVIGGGIITSLVLGGVGLVAFILGWEDGTPTYKPTVVYADKLAGGLPTACGGLTRHITDTPIIVGELWPAEKCQVEVERAVVKVQLRLAKCFKVEPPQSVFDAGTSHAWNLGVSATCGSSAMQAWNRGDWRLGCRRIYISDGGKPVWSYVKTGRTLANGKPEYKFVPGLENRRKGEYVMCIEGVK